MRKIAILFLVLSSLVLVACGGTKAPAAAPPAGGTPTPAAQPPLKIGVLLTTSGAQGGIGVKQVDGVQMAVDEINAGGGVMGRKVELVIRDDSGDPTKARTAAQELVEKEKVTMIIGTTLSAPALAVMQYLTDNKVVLFGSHSADAVNDPAKYPYAFTGSPLATQQSEVVVKYAINVLKAKKIGIISESAGYGKSAQAAFKALLEKNGAHAADIEEYSQGAIDMTQQLQKMKAAGVDAILGGTLGTDSVRILKGMLSMGWQVPYLGNSDLATSAVVDGAGPDAMKQVYCYYQKGLTFAAGGTASPKLAEWEGKFSKRFNQTPIKESLLQQTLFYDITYMLKKAVETARSTDGDKVAAAIEGFATYDGVHSTFSFSKTNHAGLTTDRDLSMVKAAGFKEGLYERAPGY